MIMSDLVETKSNSIVLFKSYGRLEICIFSENHTMYSLNISFLFLWSSAQKQRGSK